MGRWVIKIFNWKITIDYKYIQPILEAVKPPLISAVQTTFAAARQNASWNADKIEFELYRNLKRLTSNSIIIDLLFPIIQKELERLKGQVSVPLWEVEEDLIAAIEKARF